MFEEVEELSVISSKLDPETLKELEVIERREWAGVFNRVSYSFNLSWQSKTEVLFLPLNY